LKPNFDFDKSRQKVVGNDNAAEDENSAEDAEIQIGTQY